MGRAHRLFWGVAVIAVLLVAACGADGEPDEDIAYFLPTHLPADWTLGHATQRVERVAGADGDPIQVADYTIVWRPEADAGSSRSASTENDGGPSLGLNVGSAFYNETYWELLGVDPAEVPSFEEMPTIGDAKVEDKGDYLELTFRSGCCMISLTSDGVDADELHEIGASITSLDQDEWRDALGDRLLIDDQTT